MPKGQEQLLMAEEPEKLRFCSLIKHYFFMLRRRMRCRAGQKPFISNVSLYISVAAKARQCRGGCREINLVLLETRTILQKVQPQVDDF